MRTAHRILLLAVLALPALAQAEIYECTDSSGHKTYAQECPSKTAKVKEVHPTVVDPGPELKTSDKVRQANEAYEKRHASQTAKSADKDKQAADAANSAQVCADAKARLDALQTGKQAKRVDPVTGEHVPMDDAQRQAEINSLNDQVAKNCK